MKSMPSQGIWIVGKFLAQTEDAVLWTKLGTFVDYALAVSMGNALGGDFVAVKDDALATIPQFGQIVVTPITKLLIEKGNA
jgi:hypothetical protein